MCGHVPLMCAHVPLHVCTCTFTCTFKYMCGHVPLMCVHVPLHVWTCTLTCVYLYKWFQVQCTPPSAEETNHSVIHLQCIPCTWVNVCVHVCIQGMYMWMCVYGECVCACVCVHVYLLKQPISCKPSCTQLKMHIHVHCTSSQQRCDTYSVCTPINITHTLALTHTYANTSTYVLTHGHTHT